MIEYGLLAGGPNDFAGLLAGAMSSLSTAAGSVLNFALNNPVVFVLGLTALVAAVLLKRVH